MPQQIDIEDSFWTSRPMKKALRSFETSITTNPATQRRIPEDLSPEQNCCRNPKSRIGVDTVYFPLNTCISLLTHAMLQQRHITNKSTDTTAHRLHHPSLNSPIPVRTQLQTNGSVTTTVPPAVQGYMEGSVITTT